MIRILLADDHRLLRYGMRRAFEEAGEEVVGEASDGEQAVMLARQLHPDVVLMDVSMPVLDGIDATRLIRAELPETKVVMLTMHDDVAHTRRAISAGASAYLTKGSDFDEVLHTVQAVASGDTALSAELATAMLRIATTPCDESCEPVLSDRQREILQLIARGMSTKQVARDLGITQKTVHNHLNVIYRRLDTQSLTHAVLSAVRLGIIELN